VPQRKEANDDLCGKENGWLMPLTPASQGYQEGQPSLRLIIPVALLIASTGRVSMDISELRRRAGRIGGLTTYDRYGSEHMAEIGRKGAEVTWSRYNLAPIGTSQWAIVNKKTGEIKKIFCADKE
jgi:general stress protein YciG